MNGTLAALRPHLDEVFEAFYRKLLSDSHFSVFFRDDEHVRSLVRRQRENLEAALGESPEELRERYIRLGEFHRRIYVPYSDFALGIDFLAEQMFHIISMDSRLAPKSGELFRLLTCIKNYTAKGYLDNLLRDDKRDIDAFIQGLRRSREAVSGLIETHLNWLRQVLVAIEKEDEELMPALELEDSEFYHWLLSDEAEQYIPRPEDRANLFDIHRRILTDTKNMFYFVKHDYYTELLAIYTNINKQLLTLNNIVTVMFTRSKMEELARDPLTGLFSRKMLEDSLKQSVRLAQITKRHLALIIADIDNFKMVNDQYGHLAGDCVLRKTADVVRRYLRSSDDAFRYGGEEFLLVLNDTDHQGACQLAERIRHTISDMSFDCADENLRLSMSFGVSSMKTGEALRETELVAEADRQLYKAKAEGKNKVKG